jgi:hypothetical protein
MAKDGWLHKRGSQNLITGDPQHPQPKEISQSGEETFEDGPSSPVSSSSPTGSVIRVAQNALGLMTCKRQALRSLEKSLTRTVMRRKPSSKSMITLAPGHMLNESRSHGSLHSQEVIGKVMESKCIGYKRTASTPDEFSPAPSETHSEADDPYSSNGQLAIEALPVPSSSPPCTPKATSNHRKLNHGPGYTNPEGSDDSVNKITNQLSEALEANLIR